MGLDHADVRALLAKNGVGRDEFKFEAIKMSDARLECMKMGQCAAIMAAHPTDSQARQWVWDSASLERRSRRGPVTFYMDAVRREWAKTHQDAIVRYLRAGRRRHSLHPRSKKIAQEVKAIAEITRAPKDVVDRLMADYADPTLRVLSDHGEFDMAGSTTFFGSRRNPAVTAPFPPTEKFVDLTYVKGRRNPVIAGGEGKGRQRMLMGLAATTQISQQRGLQTT